MGAKGMKSPHRLGAPVGGWVDDTNYLAATDGFVVIYGTGVIVDPLEIFMGPANPAAPVRQQQASNEIIAETCPVLKGYYWRVEGSGAGQTIYWIPLE